MKSTIGRRVTAVMATLAIMWVVPLPVYGVFSALFGAIELPDGATSAQFFLSVTVVKIDFALAFVLLFELASTTLAGRWWQYAAIWWVMFALLEAGRANGAWLLCGLRSGGSYLRSHLLPAVDHGCCSDHAPQKGRRLTS